MFQVFGVDGSGSWRAGTAAAAFGSGPVVPGVISNAIVAVSSLVAQKEAAGVCSGDARALLPHPGPTLSPFPASPIVDPFVNRCETSAVAAWFALSDAPLGCI